MGKIAELLREDYPTIRAYHETIEAKYRGKALATGVIWFDASTKQGWANGQLEAAHAVDILQQVKENNSLPGEPTIINLTSKIGGFPSSAWEYQGLGHDYAAVELRWGEHAADVPYGPIGVRIFANNRTSGGGVGVGFTGNNWTRVYESEDYDNYRRLLATQRRIGDIRDLLLRKQIDLAMGFAAPDKHHGRVSHTSWEIVNPSIIKAV